MDFCVKAGPYLLALCPAATLAGYSGLLLPLSLGALLASGAAALLAPAVPVDEQAQDPGTAGLGQDARRQAEPGAGCGEESEDQAGPGDDSEPPGQARVPESQAASNRAGGDPAGPGREWSDGVRN